MTTTRPRGFIEGWVPKPHVRVLIGAVHDILDEHDDILPLTLRQIFYMLVSNYEFDKTEKAYKRLCETMNKTRRAGLISMASIRDDGFKEMGGGGWADEDALVDTFKSAAADFRLDRQDGQPARLMLWCEAGGMMPQLASAVRDFGVPVLSSGGFDSLTTKHDMARRVSYYDNVEILHIGDHDPSGVHICTSLDEDLQAFVGHYGGEVSVTRLAVTPAQVQSMGLPTAPPKSTDRRSFSGQTTQAEAIPPRRLREIVIEAIEARLDLEIYADILDQETAIRQSLSVRLADL